MMSQNPQISLKNALLPPTAHLKPPTPLCILADFLGDFAVKYRFQINSFSNSKYPADVSKPRFQPKNAILLILNF